MTTRIVPVRTALAWALCACVLGSRVVVLGADTSEERPPNILLMTVDNLGYGDLHCYNAKSKIATPRLDEFANEGVRLTQFYTASSTCTVSRACLLTGRIAQRHGLLDQLSGIDLPADVIYDGRDPLPVLTQGASSPHESLYFSYRTHAALRQGDWKIVREKQDQPWMLFYLASDIAETEDLAEAQPERTDRLAKEFLRWEHQFDAEQ